MLKKCIVVIPVYKAECTTIEEASFRQCLSVLTDYDICLITFKELDLSFYSDESLKIGKRLHIEYFNKSYFTSVAGYNRLCLTKGFYERFVHQYEYILIYQLDAWVFRNEVQYWCDKKYDYIGAPWFKAINARGEAPVYSKEFDGVGNGGLTLRRIEYCINILSYNQFYPYLKPDFLWKMLWHHHRIQNGYNVTVALVLTLLKTAIKAFGIHNNLYWFLHKKHKQPINEDYVFSLWAIHSYLKEPPSIPAALEAALFSFEVHPSYLFYELNRKLPFGCHAFEKWEYNDFWKDYIKIQ